jgi:hypothetical protein
MGGIGQNILRELEEYSCNCDKKSKEAESVKKEEITLKSLMKRIIELEKTVKELSKEIKRKANKTIVYGR